MIYTPFPEDIDITHTIVFVYKIKDIRRVSILLGIIMLHFVFSI